MTIGPPAPTYWIQRDLDGNAILVIRDSHRTGVSYWDRVYKRWIFDSRLTEEITDPVSRSTAFEIIRGLSDVEGFDGIA
jgi:hypothetical protein